MNLVHHLVVSGLLADLVKKPPNFVALAKGAARGVTYGLLAAGLILVYRSSRFINFAHAQIGAFGAAFLVLVSVQLKVPYGVGLGVGIGVGALVGAGTETLIVRPLRRAPKLMSLIATLGFGQFLLVFGLVISTQAGQAARFPQPAFMPTVMYHNAVLLTPSETAMFVFTPPLVLALVLFLKYSKYGLAITAAAANPEAADLAGFSPRRMATLAWAIAGAISAYTACLIIPVSGGVAGSSLGTFLLVRGLAAAMLARFRSIPIAVLAGIVIGIIQFEAGVMFNDTGLVEVFLLGVILVALFFQPGGSTREKDRGSWTALQPWAPLPDQLRQSFIIRHLGAIVAIAFFAAAGTVPLWASNALSGVGSDVLALACVALSVSLLTGLGGELSLGQFAVAAVGAFVSWQITGHTGQYPLGFLGATIAGAALATLLGVPALRVRGLLLAVATLAFASAGQLWFYRQTWFFGDSINPGRPTFRGFRFTDEKDYYWIVLGVTAAACVAARNIKAGGFGRLLVAMRDNEDNARAFSVGVTRRRLQGYAVAGAFAGLGGALYGHRQSSLSSFNFDAQVSVNLVAFSVIGGIGLLAGPFIGAIYLRGIPDGAQAINGPLDALGKSVLAAGWLVLILASPSGVVGLAAPLRNAVIRALARIQGIDLDAELETDIHLESAPESLAARAVAAPERRVNLDAAPILSVRGATKHWGGVTAVDNASMDVYEGERVGLIGPNGAGKTSLFEIVSGFVRPDDGIVTFDGLDITRWTPERRAAQGLIRSFQDAGLFPTMTLEDVVVLAHERVRPTRLHESFLSLSRSDNAKRDHARELISLIGLDRFRSVQVGSLSTGTRRIGELACLLALEPRLLLLDEPSAGVAQRETEALGEVLDEVTRVLGTTLVIIEHDMPMLTSLADRMIAMEAGAIVVTGTPDEVTSHPRVQAAYLGGDLTAIERSGPIAQTVVSPPDAVALTSALATMVEGAVNDEDGEDAIWAVDAARALQSARTDDETNPGDVAARSPGPRSSVSAVRPTSRASVAPPARPTPRPAPPRAPSPVTPLTQVPLRPAQARPRPVGTVAAPTGVSATQIAREKLAAHRTTPRPAAAAPNPAPPTVRRPLPAPGAWPDLRTVSGAGDAARDDDSTPVPTGAP